MQKSEIFKAKNRTAETNHHYDRAWRIKQINDRFGEEKDISTFYLLNEQ